MKASTKNLLFFAGGIAVGAALPVIIPAVVEGGRPLAKALMKHGALAIERVQLAVARASEWVDDLFAEVRSETTPSTAPVPNSVVPNDLQSLQDKKVLS